MTIDVIIERATEQNFKDLIFLIEKLAEYEHLPPPDEEASARLKHDGLTKKNPKYEAYIAKLDGKAVGYLLFFMNYSSFLAWPTLYLEDIFVLEEHRRQGIGQRLFEHCICLAKDRRCGRIEFCVLNWNEPAKQFYEKNSAKKLDWTFYRLDKDQIRDFKL
jgi:GNAT superfamily N-acetyltransferase